MGYDFYAEEYKNLESLINQIIEIYCHVITGYLNRGIDTVSQYYPFNKLIIDNKIRNNCLLRRDGGANGVAATGGDRSVGDHAPQPVFLPRAGAPNNGLAWAECWIPPQD